MQDNKPMHDYDGANENMLDFDVEDNVAQHGFVDMIYFEFLITRTSNLEITVTTLNKNVAKFSNSVQSPHPLPNIGHFKSSYCRQCSRHHLLHRSFSRRQSAPKHWAP